MKTSPFYITTPIYYANCRPHLGHAYTSILCDVMKRYHAFMGEDTFLLTGTDEHGDKLAKVAKEKEMTPKELVDYNSKFFYELLDTIDVAPNNFIRTTDETHKAVVSSWLQKLYDKGDIYFKEFSGKYCYGCERYYADDELVEGKCPDHQTEPVFISEQNYFFKMSSYWAGVRKHIQEHEDFIVPASYRNEVLGLLDQEPLDLCISRPKSRLTWGIELPFDKEFVTYVWFDALLNYLSGLPKDNFDHYWSGCHHVMAKDILKPHTIYWTTMLQAMGLPLPKQMVIHGYWLMEEHKMSKSLGNSVHPEQYCEKYSADVFRYFLIRGMTLGHDASFAHQSFIELCNADLSNNLGNLLSRVVGLCQKNTQGSIPAFLEEEAIDHEIRDLCLKLPEQLALDMKAWQPNRYVEHIMECANAINKYLQETKPWTLAKDETKKARTQTILRTALEGIRLCFAWLSPVMPKRTKEILDSLHVSLSLSESRQWAVLKDGAKLPEKMMGFPRIED